MNCAACGGDGQIEVGAYRGADSSDTRECRLCGEVKAGPLEKLAHAAASAGISMEQFAKPFIGSPQPDQKQQRETALAIAREVAQRRKEQAERDKRERLANPVTLPDTNQMSGDEIMNALIREMK